MKFRPLHDRVVVKRIEAEEKTTGGIIIPDTAKEKPSQGEVIAVGPGGRDENGKLIPIDIQVGDRVLFGKWSGTEVKIDGEELLIMKESDIKEQPASGEVLNMAGLHWSLGWRQREFSLAAHGSLRCLQQSSAAYFRLPPSFKPRS